MKVHPCTFMEFLYSKTFPGSTTTVVQGALRREKKLINDNFAQNLLSRKNSGFSIDNSVMIFGNDDKAKESLAQYIARLVANFVCCPGRSLLSLLGYATYSPRAIALNYLLKILAYYSLSVSYLSSFVSFLGQCINFF